MVETLGIIDACDWARTSLECSLERLASSRIHGQNVISWIASRVVQAQQVDRVVLATPTNQRERLARLTPAYVEVVATSGHDVLQAMVDVTARYPAQAIVRVGIDNPLVDPGLVDHLITVARSQPDVDYLSFRGADGHPVSSSQLGVFAEWCRVSALITVAREHPVLPGSERLGALLSRHAEFLTLRWIRIPADEPTDGLRFTLHGPDDLDWLDEIIDALGPDQVDWSHLQQITRSHPTLRERMAAH